MRLESLHNWLVSVLSAWFQYKSSNFPYIYM